MICLNHVYDIAQPLIECRIKGKRVKHGDEVALTFLLAGDKVRFEITEAHKGMITERIERINSIVRRKHDMIQPIAVNSDLLLIVVSLTQPSFRPRFIDRMVYIARCESIPVTIVINKIDLLFEQDNKKSEYSLETLQEKMDKSILERIRVYEDMGIEVRYTSATHGWNIDTLIDSVHHKQVSIVGQSGVGKSSLINCILPESKRKTGSISHKFNRGRHITTRPEVIRGNTFLLIDTPGIRDLYPTETDVTSLISGFPDIYRFAQACKLPNCTHRGEPECEVALHIGTEINSDRYESYLRIRESLESWNKNKWYRQKR